VARVRPLAASPLYAELITAAQAVTIAEAAADHRAASVGLAGLPVGPVLLVPLPGAPRPVGALSIGGAPGRLPFTPREVELATLLAVHAALALELRQRRRPTVPGWAPAEDRERIARDLHDVVMQRLFATGLRLQGLAPAVSAPVADTLTVAAASIDQTMADIRPQSWRCGRSKPRPAACGRR
jgi:signal transduction histidine kinase